MEKAEKTYTVQITVRSSSDIPPISWPDEAELLQALPGEGQMVRENWPNYILSIASVAVVE